MRSVSTWWLGLGRHMGSISSKNVGRSEKSRVSKHQKSKILESGGSPRAHIRWKFIVPPLGSLWKRSRASRTSKTAKKQKTNCKNIKTTIFAVFSAVFFPLKGTYFLLFGFTAVVMYQRCFGQCSRCLWQVIELIGKTSASGEATLLLITL